MRPLTILFALLTVISIVEAGSVKDVVTLGPLWYQYQSFHGINHITFEAHDLYGAGVSVYLNAGELTTFDEDSSLIHCVDVKSCSVKNLRLSTGAYTLFIYNDHYITNQIISYEFSYWSLYDEVILLTFFLIIVGSCCCGCCCVYRVCCRQSSSEKMETCERQRRGMGQMPVMDYALERNIQEKAVTSFAPYIELAPSTTANSSSTTNPSSTVETTTGDTAKKVHIELTTV